MMQAGQNSPQTAASERAGSGCVVLILPLQVHLLCAEVHYPFNEQ